MSRCDFPAELTIGISNWVTRGKRQQDYENAGSWLESWLFNQPWAVLALFLVEREVRTVSSWHREGDNKVEVRTRWSGETAGYQWWQDFWPTGSYSKGYTIWVSSQNLSLGFLTTQDSKQPTQLQKLASPGIAGLVTGDNVLSRQRTTKVLIGLSGCSVWSVSLLFA